MILSIYLFTFIWYNVDKIRIIETFKSLIKEEDYLETNIKENKKYLISSFIYSVIIYIIFILPKNEYVFSIIFVQLEQ